MTNTLPLATGKKVLVEDFFVVLSEKQSRVVLLFQCLNPTLASWCPEIVEESTGRLSVRTIRPGRTIAVTAGINQTKEDA